MPAPGVGGEGRGSSHRGRGGHRRGSKKKNRGRGGGKKQGLSVKQGGEGSTGAHVDGRSRNVEKQGNRSDRMNILLYSMLYDDIVEDLRAYCGVGWQRRQELAGDHGGGLAGDHGGGLAGDHAAVVGKIRDQIPAIELWVGWEDVEPVLSAFQQAVHKDSDSFLAFSSSLTKEQRKKVHDMVHNMEGGLQSFSHGVGKERAVYVAGETSMVYRQTVQRLREIDSNVEKQAGMLWKWCQEASCHVSQDEAREFLMNECKGSDTLLRVWEKKWPIQDAMRSLCVSILESDKDIDTCVERYKEYLPIGAIDEESGMTPLHAAAQIGALGVLELLLQHGLPVDAKDRDGATAVQVARKFDQSDAEGILQRAGGQDPDEVVGFFASHGENVLSNANEMDTLCAPHMEDIPPATNGEGALSTGHMEDVLAAPHDSVLSQCGTVAHMSDVGNKEDYNDPMYMSHSLGEGKMGAVEERHADAEAKDATVKEEETVEKLTGQDMVDGKQIPIISRLFDVEVLRADSVAEWLDSNSSIMITGVSALSMAVIGFVLWRKYTR